MIDTKTKTVLHRVEWQTASLIIATYSIWLLLAIFGDSVHPTIWITISVFTLTLFMSITHEVLHGHPTKSRAINRLMVLLPIAWSLPYERFRDTHIQHHLTGELTDPFDDPETWYVPQNYWNGSTYLLGLILTFNNTLFGRMLIGPCIGLGKFYQNEIHTFTSKPETRLYLASVWGFHITLCGAMAYGISEFSPVPLWQWLASIYLGHSLLLVRTFLEHQAAPDHSERTVIIKKACPLAFLFLYNNYHFIHHQKPGIPWYDLPKEYAQNRDTYLSANGYYTYESYREIFGKYLFRSKEPVAHPFLRVTDRV